MSSGRHTRPTYPVLRKAWILVAVVAVLVPLSVPASARTTRPVSQRQTFGLGVYAASGSPQAVEKFESSLGGHVAYVHDYLAPESWSALTDPTWTMAQWAPTRYRDHVIYSVPMMPNTADVSLAQGAAGAYNAHFRTLAQRFVAGGQGSATLRLGWEFNGNWFKWSIKGGKGAAYAEYWRQIVTTMRSVPGANFKFDWCVNVDSSWENGHQLQAETAWPGMGYVDYIGSDVYDMGWGGNYHDPHVRWNFFLTGINGLNWLQNFAASKGKRMTIPEWGIATRLYDDHGGGDSPYFVKAMYDWLKSHNVAYALYFENADANMNAMIFDGSTPQAAAAFKKYFGPRPKLSRPRSG